MWAQKKAAAPFASSPGSGSRGCPRCLRQRPAGVVLRYHRGRAPQVGPARSATGRSAPGRARDAARLRKSRRPRVRRGPPRAYAARRDRPRARGSPSRLRSCTAAPDEVAEERLRPRRADLELGVELARRRTTGGPAARASRRGSSGDTPRDDEARRASSCRVAVVDLVAVAVALVDVGLAVGRVRPACPRRARTGYGAEAHRAALVLDVRAARAAGRRPGTACRGSNSVEFALASRTTLRANSTTAHCIPRQMPRNGDRRLARVPDGRDLALDAAAPKPPGTACRRRRAGAPRPRRAQAPRRRPSRSRRSTPCEIAAMLQGLDAPTGRRRGAATYLPTMRDPHAPLEAARCARTMRSHVATGRAADSESEALDDEIVEPLLAQRAAAPRRCAARPRRDDARARRGRRRGRSSRAARRDSGRRERQTTTSGGIPMPRSSLTECCVGLVLSSPAASMYGTSVTWM